MKKNEDAKTEQKEEERKLIQFVHKQTFAENYFSSVGFHEEFRSVIEARAMKPSSLDALARLEEQVNKSTQLRVQEATEENGGNLTKTGFLVKPREVETPTGNIIFKEREDVEARSSNPTSSLKTKIISAKDSMAASLSNAAAVTAAGTVAAYESAKAGTASALGSAKTGTVSALGTAKEKITGHKETETAGRGMKSEEGLHLPAKINSVYLGQEKEVLDEEGEDVDLSEKQLQKADPFLPTEAMDQVPQQEQLNTIPTTDSSLLSATTSTAPSSFLSKEEPIIGDLDKEADESGERTSGFSSELRSPVGGQPILDHSFPPLSMGPLEKNDRLSDAMPEKSPSVSEPFFHEKEESDLGLGATRDGSLQSTGRLESI